MTETDRHSFNFDTTSVDWKTLISTSIWSVRTYNLKQTPEQLKAAEESFNYLKLLHFTFKFFICLIVPCTYWRIWGTNFLSLFIVGCLCYYFIWTLPVDDWVWCNGIGCIGCISQQVQCVNWNSLHICWIMRKKCGTIYVNDKINKYVKLV